MESSNWTQEQMLEVGLKEPDDFLKVRETLSRIGVASRREKKLYQSCHILHKQGKYYGNLHIYFTRRADTISHISKSYLH